MLSVGETLKRARLEQGLDLCTVAAQTKISAKYLEAIESDDRKLLPSGFFYKSFVEQYAKSLSLDTQEIDAEVDRVLSADEPLPLPGFESVVARNVPPITSAHRFHTQTVSTRRQPAWCWCWSVAREYMRGGMTRDLIGLKGMIDHVRAFAQRPAAQASLSRSSRSAPRWKTRRSVPAPANIRSPSAEPCRGCPLYACVGHFRLQSDAGSDGA